MANKMKNKKGFAKLPKWKQIMFIVVAVLVVAAAAACIWFISRPKAPAVTAAFLLEGNFGRKSLGSEITITGSMSTQDKKLKFLTDNEMDADTIHGTFQFIENGTSYEVYVEKIDKRLGIYYKDGTEWKLLTKPVTSSVDNPLTDFIEIDNAQSTKDSILNTLSNIELIGANEAGVYVLDENTEVPKTYKVTARTTFSNVVRMFGNSIQALYINSEYATPFAYLSKYGDYIYADVTFEFDSETYLLKNITVAGDENSIKAVASGMVQNKQNIVYDFEMSYEVKSNESKNVFVSTDITGNVSSTTDIQSIYSVN